MFSTVTPGWLLPAIAVVRLLPVTRRIARLPSVGSPWVRICWFAAVKVTELLSENTAPGHSTACAPAPTRAALMSASVPDGIQEDAAGAAAIAAAPGASAADRARAAVAASRAPLRDLLSALANRCMAAPAGVGGLSRGHRTSRDALLQGFYIEKQKYDSLTRYRPVTARHALNCAGRSLVAAYRPSAPGCPGRRSRRRPSRRSRP